MEPFFAKMGHNAICYDISNIMMTVMMVAGNSYVNKFRDGNSSLLYFGTHIAGFGRSHAFFYNFVAYFSFLCGYLILAMCFISETRTSEYGNIAAIR